MISFPKEGKCEILDVFKETKTYRVARESKKDLAVPFRILGNHGMIVDEGDKWIVYGTLNLIRSFITPFITNREDGKELLARVKNI